MEIETRKLSRENWEPWIDEGYNAASSNMMVLKTDVGSFSCRIIRLEPGGQTGMHSHDRVHHVLSLEGLPEVETDKEHVKLENLVAVRIASNVPHRFINNGDRVALIQVQNLFP